MRQFKKILLLYSIFILYSCKSIKYSNSEYQFYQIIKLNIFSEYFQLCKKEKDTLIVFDNLKMFSQSKPISIDCGKSIIVKKSNIKLNFNSSLISRSDKILLYKYEHTNTVNIFTFIHDLSNAYLRVSINSRNEIVEIRKGVY